MDIAEETSGKTFRYRAELRDTDKNRHVLSLSSFIHKIESLEPNLGDRRREAGIYEIRVTVDPVNGNEIVHAWQYYVIRGESAISNSSDGRDALDVSPASPKNNPDFHDAKAGFTPFDKQQVFNGDEIVWRNVSIARGPTTTRAIEWFSRSQPGQSAMSSQSFIYPASQSPRRAQLLDKLGVAH